MPTAGTIVILDSGKRGVLATGKTATFDSGGDCDECCAINGCDCINDNQQIVIDSSGSGACDVDIVEGDNSITGARNEYPNRCQWVWNIANTPGNQEIWLSWLKNGTGWRCHITKKVGAQTAHVYGPNEPGELYGQDITDYITCDPDSGMIAGTAILDGIDSLLALCAGETAEITLNP